MTMHMKKFLIPLLCLLLPLLLPSCETTRKEAGKEETGTSAIANLPPPIILEPGTWNDSPEFTGEPKIVVNTKEQKAYFYKGIHLVGTSPVSSGMPGRSTPKGTYRVAEKDFVRYSGTFGIARDKKTHEIVMDDFNTKKDSMPKNCYYEPARMAYCLRFYNGYCFHQGYVTGEPISHGCVRITEEMAPLFYKEAKVGMTFIVK